MTNEKSFENIKTWIRNIEQHASDDVEKMILGNKCDMEGKRKVQTEEAQQYAQENDIIFLETSAKTALNVRNLFVEIGKCVVC